MSIDYDSSRSIVFHSVCICSVQYKRETYRIPTFPTMKISFSSFIQFGNEGKGKRERKTKILKEKEKKLEVAKNKRFAVQTNAKRICCSINTAITDYSSCLLFNL